MKNSKCKICRRAGVKLFLKGEKCLSPKCVMIKKAYPPGQKRKKRPSPLSEFGKELKEKQKLKNWYNLNERQFRNHVKEILHKRGKVENAAVLLIQNLESRFDNIIFRLGIASSHAQARQLINHSHFLINGRSVNIPSRQLKTGDKITIGLNLNQMLKKHKTPSWLKLNVEKLEAEVIAMPVFEEANPPAEISAIFEYYSR